MAAYWIHNESHSSRYNHRKSNSAWVCTINEPTKSWNSIDCVRGSDMSALVLLAQWKSVDNATGCVRILSASFIITWGLTGWRLIQLQQPVHTLLNSALVFTPSKNIKANQGPRKHRWCNLWFRDYTKWESIIWPGDVYARVSCVVADVLAAICDVFYSLIQN